MEINQVVTMFKLSILVLALAAVAQAHHIPKWMNRIVGGHDVDINSYPHQISMQYYGSHICGGTRIASNIIVTAAHCTDGMSASALSVRAGSSNHASGGQVVNVREIRQHAGYNPNTMSNDISILILGSNLSVGRDAPLIGDGLVPSTGSMLTCTGWGYLWENGPMPNNLQGVDLPMIADYDCVDAYYPANIDSTMICAGFLGVGGKDACQGDSGGPLVQDGTLVGVVSWGYGCADPNYPGVFSSVGALRGWIRSNSGV